ncbi:three-helix bundle dimerization domain-containing protein [Nocardia sp. AB354]|uniref:three-helix bundle dimerization domain-containing protein n=1 Tax=Nocardia sp. AB354 TaxID=3413283 RepID=UPI003C1C5D02
MTGDEELIQVEQVIERMIACHPSVPPGDIELIVRDIHKRFSDARVHDFVPLLVEKAARQAISIRAAGTPAPASRTRPRGTRAVTVI